MLSPRSASAARFRRAPAQSANACPLPLGARAAPHARAGRAADSSADCPELKRAKSLGRTDHDQPMRWRTYESRPNGRVLSTGFSAGGPAPPSDPGQTRVSSRAPQAPRVPSKAVTLRPTSQPQSHLPALAFVAMSAARLPMSSLPASSAARLKCVAACFLSVGQTCLAK